MQGVNILEIYCFKNTFLCFIFKLVHQVVNNLDFTYFLVWKEENYFFFRRKRRKACGKVRRNEISYSKWKFHLKKQYTRSNLFYKWRPFSTCNFFLGIALKIFKIMCTNNYLHMIIFGLFTGNFIPILELNLKTGQSVLTPWYHFFFLSIWWPFSFMRKISFIPISINYRSFQSLAFYQLMLHSSQKTLLWSLNIKHF